MTTQPILYGAAYYDEYMPCERLAEDMKLLVKAGMNVIRIAESTWGTMEPERGRFDFHHIDRVLEAAQQHGLKVIVGTPTYALPAWLAHECPQILIEPEPAMVTNGSVHCHGPELYGRRQNMDIGHPYYRERAEVMIRALMDHVKERSCIIGYQLDNETKYYGNANDRIQKAFLEWLHERYGTLEEINRVFGLNYWSNRINSWEEFPDVRGTINGSLASAFDEYRRATVKDFLSWQAGIVGEYVKPGQFITQNFDYEWRGWSFGLQPQVDHFKCAEAVTLAGVDIYHPSQADLTGTEIAMGGDISRSLKQSNYLVVETQAQGFPQWTPYPGQLRLQAFSHLASGALGVMYWHWHSLHNSWETYWRGVLPHDLRPGRIYEEASVIGKELQKLSPHLQGLKKRNKVAILVSNEALSALEHYPIGDVLRKREFKYNDVMRWLYDAFYRNNIECDFLPATTRDFSAYSLVAVPALYTASEGLILALKDFVYRGGELLATFKSFFTDENVQVYHDSQPHYLGEVFGMCYNEFTASSNLKLESLGVLDGAQCSDWEELLYPFTDTKVVAYYDNPAWDGYAAVTENYCSHGRAWYLGCYFSPEHLQNFVREVIAKAVPGIRPHPETFPVIIREGVNEAGHKLTYYLNYSAVKQTASYSGSEATELTAGRALHDGDKVTLEPWGVQIVEEN
ncbi:MAG: beta-galactosidase [Succinivibrio sp.]|nr:beta-galactosidase [Succinivibrio sp.]